MAQANTAVNSNGFISTWNTTVIVTKSQDITLRTFIFQQENQLKYEWGQNDPPLSGLGLRYEMSVMTGPRNHNVTSSTSNKL